MADSAQGSTPSPKPPSEKAVAVVQEKRQHPRFKVEGSTAVLGKPSFLANIGLTSGGRAVVNLSQGGAMIRWGKRLPVESRHEIRIEIPKLREVLEGMAEVRWCLASAKSESDIYIGVQFVDLPASERRKLAGMYELFTSTEYKAMAAVRKDASSVRLKMPPKP